MTRKKIALLTAAVLGTASPLFAQGEPPPPYVSVGKSRHPGQCGDPEICRTH